MDRIYMKRVQITSEYPCAPRFPEILYLVVTKESLPVWTHSTT